jgi:hypothetical protein
MSDECGPHALRDELSVDVRELLKKAWGEQGGIEVKEHPGFQDWYLMAALITKLDEINVSLRNIAKVIPTE